MNQQYGFWVKVKLDKDALLKTYGEQANKVALEFIYRNITEIHYKYDTIDSEPRIAFESEIWATGYT